MEKEYNFFVYILSSNSKTLYIGVTNDIRRRVFEHKTGLMSGFSKRYHCNSLVYYEHYSYIDIAINREKQLKKWSREKKIKLIEKNNNGWEDLSTGWY